MADATATACGNLLLPEQQGYFAEEVKQQLLNDPKYNVGADYSARYNSVFGGGLKVYTTLNPMLQTASENAIRDIVPQNDKGVVGVSVSIEPSSGAVRAMVGGPGFDYYQYNITTHQPGRQTGSSFKTYVLLTAFEQGNVPADYVGGAGSFPNPGGEDKTYEVPSGNGGSLTSVTTSSSNGAFVRLGYVVGLENVVDLARKLGITSDLPTVPSMPLGTLLTTPIEMASAYSAIPNGGVHEPYYLIDQCGGAFDREGDLAVVHFARGADQRGVLAVGGDQEPGVDRDAMAADARAGRQDVDARVAVGEPDHLPHVDAHPVGDDREFIGEGDVDVAERVLGQLGHLRGARGRGDTGAADEAAIELQRAAGAARGDPADDAIVVDQLDEDATGQHPLRAIGDRDIGLVGEAG